MLLLLPLQELLRAIPWVTALVLADSGSGHGALGGLAGVMLAIAAGSLRWFTTSYRISRDQVEVRRGLIRRRNLTVLRDRIRSVDLTAHVLHRMLGLASITIGTGRSDRKDERGLKLDGLSARDAAWVREELLHNQGAALTAPVGAPDQPGETQLVGWRPGWILFGPFTLSGAVTVLVLVGFGYQIVSETRLNPAHVGPVQFALHALGAASTAVAALAIVVATATVVAIASTLGYVLSFWNFRLVRLAGTLQVTRGLLTKRVVTIDERRLRGVEVSEPLLLRWVHGARCIAIATGLRVGRGAERGGSMLLPPAPRRIANEVAAAVLGSEASVQGPLIQHGRVAHRRRYTRVLAVTIAPLLVLMAAWWVGALPAWPWQALVGLLAVGMTLATDRYHSLGHAVVVGRLVTRSGSLVRRRCILSCDGIIGWNLHQSFFQRQAQLVTLTATTAAGRQAYRVQDVGLEEAVRVAEQARPGLLLPFLEVNTPTGHPPTSRAPSG